MPGYFAGRIDGPLARKEVAVTTAHSSPRRSHTATATQYVLNVAVTPLMLKTAANPGGLPMEKFDQIRAGVLADRSQFFKDEDDESIGAAAVEKGAQDYLVKHQVDGTKLARVLRPCARCRARAYRQ